MQSSGYRHVVDVVAGRRCPRSVLPPACDTAIDEPGIALQTGIRSQSEAFHHSGPETLDQDVGLGDET